MSSYTEDGWLMEQICAVIENTQIHVKITAKLTNLKV